MDSLAVVAAWVAAVSALGTFGIALFALIPARQSAKASRDLADAQREAAVREEQPNVWAGIQPDTKQASVFCFMVKNEGPSVARDVSVVVDPPLKNEGWDQQRIDLVQEKLRDGIRSLVPGQRLEWFIGFGHEIAGDESQPTYTITVTANGPHGAVEPVEFESRPSDFALANDQPDGSLHLVAKKLDAIIKKLG